MNWLKELFKSKQTRMEHEKEVSDYVHDRKNEFVGDMAKLKRVSKRLHIRTLQSQDEAVKLNILVEDITSKIARVTPGGKHR